MSQERERTGLGPGSLRVTELAGVEKDRVTLIFMAWHGMASFDYLCTSGLAGKLPSLCP